MKQIFKLITLLCLTASIGLGLSSCSQKPESTISSTVIIGEVTPQLKLSESAYQARVIVYTNSVISKQILTSTMQKATSTCTVSHLRILSTGGHVIIIDCVSELEYKTSLNSFNELSIIKEIEIDRLMTIGS